MVPPNFPTMKFFSSVFHSIIYSSQNAKLRQFFVGNLQKAWGRNVQMISSLGGARLIGSSCTLHIKLSVCVFSHVIIGHGLQTFPMRRSSLQMILHCSFQPELLQDPVHSSTYNMPHQYLTQVNCSEIFIPVITDLGVCCGFNLGIDLKESEYSSLVKEMQVTFLIILWNYLMAE